MSTHESINVAVTLKLRDFFRSGLLKMVICEKRSLQTRCCYTSLIKCDYDLSDRAISQLVQDFINTISQLAWF